MSRLDPEPELTVCERSLAALSPSRGLLDRDRVIFEVGRRSATLPDRFRWVWPAVAASLAAVTLGQTLALTRRPEPEIVERLVAVQPHALTRETTAEPEGSPLWTTTALDVPSDDPDSVNPYLSLRRQIERHGLDGLPNPAPFLTFSQGAGASEAPLDEPPPLRPYDLGEFLDTGGPS